VVAGLREFPKHEGVQQTGLHAAAQLALDASKLAAQSELPYDDQPQRESRRAKLRAALVRFGQNLF